MSDVSLAFDEKLELRSWGLPHHILKKYLDRGISKMFPWQVECLLSENVLLGGNLIYSAPTSAGKTLVSEILALKTVLERKKKVIVILPFVSVVREKMLYFQEILTGSGVKVDGFMGSYNPPGGFKNVSLAICTIEKANNLINRMLEEKNFEDIGCIVVDELHLLGDPHRGYLLELLLTKLKYVCQKGIAQSIQIVGMSATLPNLDVLAKWLNATLYHTEFRPIPLFEYLKIGKTVYKSPELIQSFDLKAVYDIPNDPEDVVSICIDTIIQGFSALVFCPSKNWCETLALQISGEIKRIGNEKGDIALSLRTQLNSRGIYDTLEQLKKCPSGLERNLSKSVCFGVAYHHAGLTLDERDIIEGGFRRSIIRILVATSTLSSGVNLPARRVIIRSPAFQGHCMDILTYKQMIGRAGRMGKDTAGESYLICTPQDVHWGKQLVTSELPPVESCLGNGDLSTSLKRALLEVIAGGVVTSNSEVEEYTKCTLLALTVNNNKLISAIQSCTEYLSKNEFIKIDSDGGVIPSSLAEACLSSSVAPDQALYLLKELHKARQCFVLDSDLHAIYQVTPYSICDSWSVDWMKVFAVWEELPPNLQKIGDLVGVEDRFLIRAMRGTINLNSEEFAHKISIHKRFYTCLALQDLINEMPINDVAMKYGCTKGMLQSLQQSASTFAAMVTSFCRKLGWGGLEVLLSELAARIQFGVQKELLDLLRLDSMTSLLARALFNAQITTLSELASSNLQAIQLAVNKAKPFKSELMDTDSQEKKNVYLPGRPGLSEKEAAEILIIEARSFLLKEMGVKTAEWEERKTQVNDPLNERTTIVTMETHNNTKIDASSNLENHKKQSAVEESNINNIENRNGCEVKPGKSSPVPMDLNLLGQNDIALADTVEISYEDLTMNISQIKRLDILNESVPVPEVPLSSLSIMSERESLTKEESPFENHHLVKYRNSRQLDHCDKSLCLKEMAPDSTIHNPSESVSFPLYVAKVNVCSTYLVDETNTADKFSMEAMLGSPNNSNGDIMDSLIHKITFENRISPICFMASTPVTNNASPDVHSNTSSNDLFSESPKSRMPEVAKSTIKSKNLEELDPNWGGDSLLEFSQYFENKTEFHNIETSSTKRKTRETPAESMPLRKRICLNNCNSSNISSPTVVTPKEHVNLSHVANSNLTKESIHSFGESFEFNTQMEDNILKNIAGKSPADQITTHEPDVNNKVRSKEKGLVKLNSRPKSDGDLTPIIKKSKENFRDTINYTNIAKSFDGTFKLSQLIEDSEKVCNTLDDVHISDSEDLIIASPDSTQESKTDLNCYKSKSNRAMVRTLSLINSPIKTSPRSSPKRNSSPTKYLPIGGDILKLYKSPSSKKILQVGSPPRSSKQKNKLSSAKQLYPDFLKSSYKCIEQKQEISSPKKSDGILSLKTPEYSPKDGSLSHVALQNCESVSKPRKSDSSSSKFLTYQNKREVSKKILQKTGTTLPSKTSDSPLFPQIKTDSVQVSSIKTLENEAKNLINISNAKSVLTEDRVTFSLSTKPSKVVKELHLNTESKVQQAETIETKRSNLEKNGRLLDVVAIGENGCSTIDGIYKLKELVFTIKTKIVNDKETQKSQIGGRIVRYAKNEEAEPQFKVDDQAIVGIYLYGGSTVYYFNMMTLGTSHYRILKNLFSQKAVKLCGYNMNPALKLFYKCCGYIISCRMFDLAVADWLLNPQDNIKSLEEMGSEYLRPHPHQRSFKYENDILTEVSLIWSLQRELSSRLQMANLLKHFEEIEMPIQSNILFMELTGIGFKHEIANQLWSTSTELMGKLEMDAFSFANHKFPLNSNSELLKIKKELKITPENEADHPLLITVHNWRKLYSLKTRNLGQLLFKHDSRCHSSSSSRTVTGRIMVHEPDLQHVPRDFTVDGILFSLRSAFVPQSGNVLVSADYSQLELRILAHFSQDPILVPLLRKGDDIFKNIAAEWNGIPTDKVNDDLRQQVKQLTYGIIYGMGDKVLGEALGKSSTDAGMLSARFKRSFPKLEEFIKRTIDECRQSGQVKTLAGRVRNLPGINSSNVHVKAQAERQAVNSKIQGSASDIAKKAMVEVENNLNKRFPGRSNLPSSLHTSHLVLQLHDEFIYEVEEIILDSFVPILRDTMETATFLSVPLPVVVKSGTSWGSLKPLSS